MLLAPWVTPEELPPPLPSLPGGDAQWAAMCAVASEVLYARTARRWGGAGPRTLELMPQGQTWRLSAPPIRDGWASGAWGGSLVELAWADIVGFPSGNADGAWGGRRQPVDLRLPDYPVRSVALVTVAGATLDPAAYRLRDRRWLTRTDGGLWVNTLDTNVDALGSGVTVTYTSGQAPPTGGVESAKALAVQLGKAVAGDADCELPGSVIQTTRQGTTSRYVTLLDMLKAGGTGLPLVDLWVKSVNPDGRQRRARYWSPDSEPRAYPVA